MDLTSCMYNRSNTPDLKYNNNKNGADKMDLTLGIIFLVFGFLSFLFALFEERENKKDEDEEEKSDHLVFLLLILSVIFISISGAVLMSATTEYYSPVTNTIEVEYLNQYDVFGWFCFGLAMIPGVFTAIKGFEIMETRMSEENA